MTATENILPDAFERYLICYKAQVRSKWTVQGMRRVLSSFNTYLQNFNITLYEISIEQVDHFLAVYNKNYAPGTCRSNRSHVRKFLSYLYQEGCIKKCLAHLVVSPPEFARSKPPKFLRQKEVQQLLNSLVLSDVKDLRTYAVMHLAYYLGLRPKEISSITLNDISFRQKEIFIQTRKNHSPAHLPLPDNTIRAITAYIVGARPESKSRALFLQLIPPYKPATRTDISRDTRELMHDNNLAASIYWLRHSYAQNLLESGASIFEIKEMMGHKSIESTKKYLSIHINLMRKVILDETL